MELIIRNTGEQPIYEQVRSQIAAQILSGNLPPGTLLPSIRALAKDLRISVITTKRAYEELEREGFLVTMPGKGSFVAELNLALQREQKMRDAETRLREAVQLARQCGLSDTELLAWIHTCLEEEQNERN